MKIEDLWQSIEKEEEEKKFFIFYSSSSGGKLYKLHTLYSTLLLNALSFRIVREMMLGCRHLLLQLIKKLFPFLRTFCVYKSEKKLVRRKLDRRLIFLCLNFPAK